jgi:hypothetical protein
MIKKIEPVPLKGRGPWALEEIQAAYPHFTPEECMDTKTRESCKARYSHLMSIPGSSKFLTSPVKSANVESSTGEA